METHGLMSTSAGRSSSRAGLERGLKIGLALAVLVVVVFALVGRQGRLAEAEALAIEQARLRTAVIAPKSAAVPRIPSPSLAEAPIGRALPPVPIAAAAPSHRLGGPKSTSVTALAEQMGPPAPRLRLLARPVAIDNATFAVGASRIQLLGIEPMAVSELCGTGTEAWRCGIMARTALRGWLRARSINCSVPDDFERRNVLITSRCQIGEEDVALWLAENGWARPTTTGAYYVAGEEARKAGRGIWNARSPAAP